MSELATLQVFTSEVREDTLDDRVYLVAPVIAVMNGVMNDEYVSTQELLYVPVELWNDIPLPIQHPQKGGQDASARSVAVIEERVCGRFYNARYEVSGNDVKLKGELWVDIEKTVAMGDDGTQVVNRLRSGQPLEVSTAYFRDVEDAPGAFNGVAYGTVAHNLRPDHLALLPGEIGACSWADGCGAPRVNAEERTMLKVNLQEGESYQERLDNVLGAVREKFITGEDWAYVADLYEDRVVYVAGSANSDEAHFQVGYSIAGSEVTFIGQPVKVEREVTYTVAQNKESNMKQNNCETGILNRIKRMLGVNTMDRDAMVAELVESGVDAAILEGASDEAVSLLHERSKQEDVEEVTEVVEETVEAVAEEIVPAVNAETVIDGVRLGDIARFVKNKQAEVAEEHSGLVAALVANERCTLSKEVLEAASPCLLKELVANFAPGNYFGAGMPRGPVQQVPAPPSIVLRKVGE